MATGDGSNFSTSPLMGLRSFTPGVCGALGVEPPGTSWGETIGYSFSVLDGHTHASGFGAQVPAAGLNINADLPFGSNNLTSLRSARFSAIGLGTLGAADLGCMLVSGADLYYVDTAGNQIRMTAGGGVAGSPGSISGLVSPAAASYTPASKLFALTSSSGFAANLSCGPLSLTDSGASGGKAATIAVPGGLAANYNLTLPAALPAASTLLAVSPVGAMSVPTGSTISAGSNVLQNVGAPSATSDAATKGYVDTTFPTAAHSWGSTQTFSGGIVLGGTALFLPAAAYLRQSALEGDGSATLSLLGDTKFASFAAGRAVTSGAMGNDGVGRATATNAGVYRVNAHLLINTASISSTLSVVLRIAKNGVVIATLADAICLSTNAGEDLNLPGELVVSLAGGDFIEVFYNASGGSAGSVKAAQLTVARIA